MRRRKLLFTLLFGLCLILTSAALLAGRSFSLAKEEKELFNFENIKTPQLYKIEKVPPSNQPVAIPASELEKLPNLAELRGKIKKDDNLTALIAGLSSLSVLEHPADSSELEALIQEFVEKLLPQPADASEIKISRDNSEKNRQRYLKELAGIEERYSSYLKKNLSSNLFQEAIINKNSEPLKEIEGALLQILDEYKNLEVPSELAGQHLLNIDVLKKILWAFELLEQYPKDPAKALVGLGMLENLGSEIKKFYGE